MKLEQMYQQVILDHYKHPHGRGLRDSYDVEVHHVNPLCGDQITLRLKLQPGAGAGGSGVGGAGGVSAGGSGVGGGGSGVGGAGGGGSGVGGAGGASAGGVSAGGVSAGGVSAGGVSAGGASAGGASAGGVISVSYQSQGCSISQAAASVMFDQVEAEPLAQALRIGDEFGKLLKSATASVEVDEDLLGDGIAFAGVAKYPARVKCALLPWMALRAAALRAAVEQVSADVGNSGGQAGSGDAHTKAEFLAGASGRRLIDERV